MKDYIHTIYTICNCTVSSGISPCFYLRTILLPRVIEAKYLDIMDAQHM